MRKITLLLCIILGSLSSGYAQLQTSHFSKYKLGLRSVSYTQTTIGLHSTFPDEETRPQIRIVKRYSISSVTTGRNQYGERSQSTSGYVEVGYCAGKSTSYVFGRKELKAYLKLDKEAFRLYKGSRFFSFTGFPLFALGVIAFFPSEGSFSSGDPYGPQLLAGSLTAVFLGTIFMIANQHATEGAIRRYNKNAGYGNKVEFIYQDIMGKRIDTPVDQPSSK